MSRTIIIEDPINRYQARVNSSGELLVAGVGGGGTGNVNLSQYGGVAVGAGNALHVQPGTGAVFTITPDGGTLTVGGTVAVSNFPATQAVTQSGAWSVTAVQATHDNLNLNANVQQGDADVAAGNGLYVQPGTGAVFTVTQQGGDEWVVGQSIHANLNAQVRLQDKDSSGLLSVLKSGDAGVFPLDEYGILPLFEVTDSPFATGGTFTHGRMNEAGSIYVQVTGWSGLTVAGDFYSGQGGLPAMVRRQDTPTSGASVNGQWTYPISDSTGKLWVNVGNSTLAVTQSGSWSATVTQATHANLNATVRLQDGNGTNLLDVIQSGDKSPSYNDHTAKGIMPVAWYSAGEEPTIVDDAWNPLRVDASSYLLVNASGSAIFVNSLVPGTSATALGKAEDAVHASGDTGVMMLAVRQDTLASSVSAAGDYGALKLDSVGALWVRQAGVTTIPFSASTRGRPVQIVATASAGTTLHTATTTSGQLDRVYIDLTNTSAATVTVTIEFGTTGTAAQVKVAVPPNDTIRAIDGWVLGGGATDVIRAFASTASVVNAVGRIERLS